MWGCIISGQQGNRHMQTCQPSRIGRSNPRISSFPRIHSRIIIASSSFVSYICDKAISSENIGEADVANQSESQEE